MKEEEGNNIPENDVNDEEDIISKKIQEEILDQNNIQDKEDNEDNYNNKEKLEDNNNIENDNEEKKNEIKENLQTNSERIGEKYIMETPQSNKVDKEKTISIIKSKIKELKNNYNFYTQYNDIIFKIIKNLEDLTYEKIANSLQDSYNYLSFFKNSSELYSKFADKIKNSNNILTSSKDKPKMSSDFLNDIMQNTQDIFYQNLLKFSTGLKQNIIAKGPLSKLHEKTNKIENIKKTQFKKYHEIDEKRKKFEKKYKTYQKLFDSFLPEEKDDNKESKDNKDNKDNNKDNKDSKDNKDNKDNNNIINNDNTVPSLIDSPDFLYIIKDSIEEIKNLILQNNLYVIDTKDALYSINNLFVEINNLVKESILIYIQESKIFFNIDVNTKFEEIENYFKKLDEEQKDNIFKLDTIFSEQKQKENIFNVLQQYYELLSNSEKVKKELVSDKSLFSLEKYSNIIDFFEWLISISPQPTDISIDDFILKKIEIKRDPGIFSKWKSASMVFTKQNHLIVFDKVDSFLVQDIVTIFELDKITYRIKEDKKDKKENKKDSKKDNKKDNKNENKKDNKKPLLFEIIAKTKGKLMNFKGSLLYDGLNNENMNEISNYITVEESK